ncbi:hypothetical protein B0A52_04525 [Exophiala mesophila]|uniref:Enoyl reductase (ER) domain-containing protein n=1 Tax=Exophiala mesophila TaxID=212818 RepID=A0A438N968_EXOME|nr:hypothetical protein B0A52_04525 [Exophiala mesophila]
MSADTTTTNKVKSWIYTKSGYPETLEFSTTEVPNTPAPTSVLIQVHATALNPVDIQLMNLPTNSLPSLNGVKIPARDFAGTVLAAGPDVKDLSTGDQVYGISLAMNGTGFLTEIAHIDTKGASIIKKPAHLSWVQAASLPLVYLTARTSIEKCVPFLKASNPADNKLVVLGGSSATGIYTLQIAKSRGWTVLASCSGKNVDFVKSQGASEVVDYTTSETAVVDAIKRFAPGAIIDCVGGTDAIGLAPQFVTIVGDKTSRATMGGSALYATRPRMVLRWLLGYLGLAKSYECIILDPKIEWLQETLDLDPEKDVIIDSVFQFEQAKDAFERLDTGRARGKVVVQIKES